MGSDRDIVEGLKCGSRDGVRRLLLGYQARLVHEATLVFRVPTPDAEEIVSDVLLTVVQKIATFEFRKGEGDFAFWVVAIFRNRVRDFFRKRAASPEELTSLAELHDEGEDLPGAGFDPVGKILGEYQAEQRDASGLSRRDGTSTCLRVIADTLDAMESWERVLLRCRALDVPYEEIAQYTGKTVEQLRVYHPRVRKRFVRMLARHYPELDHA